MVLFHYYFKPSVSALTLVTLTVIITFNLMLFIVATFHDIFLENFDILGISHNFNIKKSNIFLKYIRVK